MKGSDAGLTAAPAGTHNVGIAVETPPNGATPSTIPAVTASDPAPIARDSPHMAEATQGAKGAEDSSAGNKKRDCWSVLLLCSCQAVVCMALTTPTHLLCVVATPYPSSCGPTHTYDLPKTLGFHITAPQLWMQPFKTLRRTRALWNP